MNTLTAPTKKKSEHAQVAALIRKELKAAFPAVKFSVTSDSYTGGSSVDIYYFDAITSDKVEAIVNKYQGGWMNSMEDIYEYNKTNEVEVTVKFVFVKRRMSEATEAALTTMVQNQFAGCEGKTANDWIEGHRCYMQEIVRREFNKTEIK